ncbi:hypothetical protein G6F32_017138 [Rhizopus arrhizus]|nr:hypothetical protein G6F32_017138 [Rhizopus arrhizus]
MRWLTLTLLYRLTLMSTSLCPQLTPPHMESTAATPRPMKPAMFGVPASNLCGASLNTVPSKLTSLIISPPPRNGGIASRCSRRAHSAPVPVGPHILWPVMA